MRRMPKDVYNITYIIDMKDNNLSWNLITKMKVIIDQFGEYYSGMVFATTGILTCRTHVQDYYC